jgi:hypothetical protein
MASAAVVFAIATAHTAALQLNLRRVPPPSMLTPTKEELPTMYRNRWHGERGSTSDEGREVAVSNAVEDAGEDHPRATDAADTACVDVFDKRLNTMQTVCGEVSFDSSDDGMVGCAHPPSHHSSPARLQLGLFPTPCPFHCHPSAGVRRGPVERDAQVGLQVRRLSLSRLLPIESSIRLEREI